MVRVNEKRSGRLEARGKVGRIDSWDDDVALASRMRASSCHKTERQVDDAGIVVHASKIQPTLIAIIIEVNLIEFCSKVNPADETIIRLTIDFAHVF
jgi:hypothetical protein